MAYEAAKEDAKEMLAEPVPLVIRNAPTDLMKELHYGDGYVYAHDTEEKNRADAVPARQRKGPCLLQAGDSGG